MKRKRLGEMLIEKGLITKVQLSHALERQKKWGGRLGSNLVKAGVINERDLLRFLAEQTGIREIDLAKVKINRKALQKLPRKIAMKHVMLPLGFKDKKTLVVACVDPTDLNTLDEVAFITGYKIHPMIAPYSSIYTALNNIYNAVPLADNSPVHGDDSIEISTDPMGGGHESAADPELIIYGEQTLDNLPPMEATPKPDQARPLTDGVKIEAPEPPGEDDDEFTLDFAPINNSGAASAAKAAPQAKVNQGTQFTMDQKLMALYHLLIKKGLITEKEIERELMRLWSLGKL